MTEVFTDREILNTLHRPLNYFYLKQRFIPAFHGEMQGSKSQKLISTVQLLKTKALVHKKVNHTTPAVNVRYIKTFILFVQRKV